MISKPRDHACERQSTFIQASTPHLPTSHYASSYASALRRLRSSCHVLLQAARVVRVSTMLMNHAFHFSQTNSIIIIKYDQNKVTVQMFSGLQTYVIVQLSIDLPVAMQNAM